MKENGISKVRVGNINYDLYIEQKEHPGLDGDRGTIWYEKLKIFISNDIPSDLQVQTLYHELAHALCQETSFNELLMDALGEETGYEMFIGNLGKAIYSLIHDNDMKSLEKLFNKEETKES